MKLFDYIVRSGPWALVVVIVLAGLAGEYGIVNSQTRRNADAIERITVQTMEQQKSLDKIVTILEDQRKIQAQAALIACFKEAKYDSDRAQCIKQFTVK